MLDLLVGGLEFVHIKTPTGLRVGLLTSQSGVYPADVAVALRRLQEAERVPEEHLLPHPDEARPLARPPLLTFEGT